MSNDDDEVIVDAAVNAVLQQVAVKGAYAEVMDDMSPPERLAVEQSLYRHQQRMREARAPGW